MHCLKDQFLTGFCDVRLLSLPGRPKKIHINNLFLFCCYFLKGNFISCQLEYQVPLLRMESFTKQLTHHGKTWNIFAHKHVNADVKIILALFTEFESFLSQLNCQPFIESATSTTYHSTSGSEFPPLAVTTWPFMQVL